MRIYARRMLTEAGFASDQVVTIEDGVITAIEAGREAPFAAEILTPGLIDVHCHGGEGFNAKDRTIEAIAPFLQKMLRSGVTHFLLTISTAKKETMRRALALTREAMARQARGVLGGARILGAHLEGPFLSSARPGAMQQDAIVRPSVDAYRDYFSGYEDIIRLVTLAPEEQGAEELIAYLHRAGIKVQAGHTYATYDQAVQGFSWGAESLCHSFNACRGIHHREPGVVTAALENPDVYMEAICDFLHLHPAIVKLIYREKGPDRMLAVSDSVLSHGLPDGEYRLEGYHLVVRDGITRTVDGALDGGVAYLDQAVRNLISVGVPAADALRMASRTPARRMGLEYLGDIAVGKEASLTAWDGRWQVVRTFVRGQAGR